MNHSDDSALPASAAPRGPEVREDFGSAERQMPLGASPLVCADFETEKALLAVLLSEPETLKTALPLLGSSLQESPLEDGKKKKKTQDPGVSVFRRTASRMFQDPKHQLIYEAILEVSAKQSGYDILTVADYLQKTNRLAVIGGLDFLAEMQASAVGSANIEGWCANLHDYAMLREIIRTCNGALDICRNPSADVHQTLDLIDSAFFNVRNDFTRTDIKDFTTLLHETFRFFNDVLSNKLTPGIMTEFADLDRLTGGLRKQEMFVLAARPSIGKTSFALNIVRNIMMKEVPGVPRKKVAFFSLEMSAEQVTQRLLCAESRVSLRRIMDRTFQLNELTRISTAANQLSKAQLFIDPTGGLSVYELRAKARKLKELHGGLDLVVIDYLTLMRAEVKASDGRQVEVAAISGGLKKLAKDLDVPVLVLAQLNRDVEKGQSKNTRPKLVNLRESGAIEQDADIVVLLHRDRDESKNLSPEAEREGVPAEAIVEKNRNGATGTAELRFFADLMEFRSVDHKYQKSDASH